MNADCQDEDDRDGNEKMHQSLKCHTQYLRVIKSICIIRILFPEISVCYPYCPQVTSKEAKISRELFKIAL